MVGITYCRGQGCSELGDRGIRGAHKVLGEAFSGLLHTAPGSPEGLCEGSRHRGQDHGVGAMGPTWISGVGGGVVAGPGWRGKPTQNIMNGTLLAESLQTVQHTPHPLSEGT